MKQMLLLGAVILGWSFTSCNKQNISANVNYNMATIYFDVPPKNAGETIEAKKTINIDLADFCKTNNLNKENIEFIRVNTVTLSTEFPEDHTFDDLEWFEMYGEAENLPLIKLAGESAVPLNSKFFQPSYISSDDLLPYAEKPSIEISGRGMLRRDHPSTTRIKADIQLSLRAVVMNLGEFNLGK
jgi:hypothetical protein